MGDVPVSASSTIQGCTLLNNSDSDCQVELEYGVDGKHTTVFKFGVSKGAQREQKEMKIADLPQGRVRINIVRITIVRKNGEKQTLNEPFDHVYKPSPNWLFTIDNQGFYSSKTLASY